jgi:hypothetical protein
MSADSFLGAALRSGGPFKDPGSMRIWGPAPFFPASERRESGMEIILRWDGNRFPLRQPIWCAPSGKFFDRGVDLAFSEIGGKRFAGFHFGVLRQLLDASRFCFGSEFIRRLKFCDMSHEMAISIMNVSKGSEVGLRKFHLRI